MKNKNFKLCSAMTVRMVPHLNTYTALNVVNAENQGVVRK